MREHVERFGLHDDARAAVVEHARRTLENFHVTTGVEDSIPAINPPSEPPMTNARGLLFSALMEDHLELV
jgi:hypothetical protein